MQFDIPKVLKQAWQITKTQKFLWIYGLFLLWGDLYNVSYHFGNNDQNQKEFIDMNQKLWLQEYSHGLLAGAILIFLVICLLVYMYFRSVAGSILAVKNIVDKKETNFVKSFREGRKFFTRIASIFVIVNLALLMILIVVVAPIVYLSNALTEWQLAFLILLGLLIIVPGAVGLTLLGLVAPMFAVIYNMTTKNALRAGISMVSERWKELILFGLIVIGIMSLLFFLAIVMAAPFVVLGVLAYHKVSGPASIALNTALLTLATLVFLAVQAGAAVFQQSAWALAFLELVKPQKTEEAVQALPEVAV